MQSKKAQDIYPAAVSIANALNIYAV